MNSDNFDKDLASLYQQRKAQVIAPEVQLKHSPTHSKYSPLKLLSIFFIAGSTSFGILAIISHFSNQVSTPNEKTYKQVTQLVELTPIEPKNEIVIPVKPLPPKPVVKTPEIQQTLEPIKYDKSTEFEVNLIETVNVKVLNLPQLNKPLSIAVPTYKALPKYPSNAAQSGEVALSYQIDDEGKVTDIKIVDSNVNHVLQRSAKRALSKWQYTSNTETNDELTVKFVFTKPEE